MPLDPPKQSMEQSHEEIEEVITRRLIKKAESEEVADFDSATPTTATTLPKEGESTPVQKEELPDDQEETAVATGEGSPLPPATFAKVEKSLASLGFFTPSSRRLKNEKVKRISFTREVEGKRVEVSAEIIPSAIFGLPVTADQDKYLGLQKIITDLQASGVVTNPIRFRSADLLRLLNRNTKTGKNYKEVSEWLDVMKSTTIISNGVVYIAGQKRFARDRFNVFDRAVSVGAEMEDGSVADANYVWLSSWQLQNINNNFLLPIDLESYRQLKNHISKALVPLLQIWLFASHKNGSFEKRYDELCEILNVRKFPAPSQILRQLKPSLDELTRHEYLARWQIERTSDRKAYKIVFFHGPKFHRDRRRRLEQKQQTESPVIIAQSEPVEPNLPEPGRLEPEPAAEERQKKTPGAGEERANDLESKLVEELSARGLMPSVAIKLLKSLPRERLERVGDYVDYWDGIPGEKGPGLLHSLIQNNQLLPANFETRRERTERQAAEERRQKQDLVRRILHENYEEHRRQAVDRYIAEQVPPEEFARLVAEQKARDAQQGSFWKDRPQIADEVAQYTVRKEIAAGVPITAFDDFRRRELRRILADLGLNAAELGIELPPLAPETTTTP